MLQVVALVFERVESFIFNLPTATTNADQLFNIVLADVNICYPAVEIGVHTMAIELLILKVIDLHVEVLTIENE